jgi:hypothetical protein
MRRHLSSRTLAALPPWARAQSAFYPDKPALKAAAHTTMRARERTALDALRHGADPDAATLPTRSRDVADRWAYD